MAIQDDIIAAIKKGFEESGAGSSTINITGADGSKVSADGMQELIDKATELSGIYKNLGDSNDHRILQQQQEIEVAKLKLAQAQKMWEEVDKNDKEAANAALQKIKDAHEYLALQNEQLETLKGTSQAIKESIGHAKELGNTLGSALGQYGKHAFFNTDTIYSLYKALRGGKASFGAFVGSLGTALLTNFVNSFINLIFELDKAESELKRLTGANDNLANSMTNAYAETRLYGVSIEEMSGQYKELYSTFTDFTFANEEQQRELAKTGALLQELGVSAKDYAVAIQTSTKAFGMSKEEAAASSRELASLAIQIGVPPGEMASQFAEMGQGLAKLGEDGVGAFKDLAIVSKTTGLEMRKLLAITDKFDTFEGAADQAGKLNAALGGNFVNAMDLMMATDPAERFGMIRDSILDTGLTFDSMSYYQRNFYKDALGLESVSDLALMLSGDMSTLEGATQKTSDEYAALAERTKAVQSITEKFETLMASMIPVVTPLIDELQKMADEILNNEETMASLQDVGKAFVEVLRFIGKAVGFVIENWKIFAAIGAVILVAKVGTWVKSLFKFKDAADDVGESMSKKLAESVKEVGEAAQKNAKGLLALGGAIALVGVGVAAAALGVAEIVKAFGEAGDNAGAAVVGILAFGAVMIGLVATFMAMAPAAAVAAGPLLALGAAIFLLGAGVGVAAYGMSILVESFVNMFNAINVEAMDAVVSFFGSLALMSPALGSAATSIGGLALSLGGLRLAIALFDEDDTAPLTNVLNSFASTTTTEINATTEAIKKLNAELQQVPDEKAIALTRTLQAATVAGPAVMAAAVGMKAVTEVVHTLLGGKDEDGATHPPINMNVALNLDGNQIDKRIIEVVNGQVKKSSLE